MNNDAFEKRRRFLINEQVADELAVGAPTIRHLLRAGELSALQIGRRNYLARLLGWIRIVARFTGEERRMRGELSARSVRIVECRCSVVGA